MKKLIFLVAAFSTLLFTACEEDCFTTYKSIDVSGVSKKSNSGKEYKGWYETDYLVNEINLKLIYKKHTEVFADCKTFKLKHGINFSDINIVCSNPLVIGSDTVAANTNLYNYFKSTNYNDEATILTWDTSAYAVPVGIQALNMFNVTVPLSDGIKLSKSALLSLSK